MKTKPMTATTTATSTADLIKPPFKIERVLLHLVTKGSINRLEAEKAPVFDHALNSTMSNEVKQRLGLSFTSLPERHSGYQGLSVIYHRYQLTDESADRAKVLINEYRLKRGADPVNWENAA
ncbi:hypothetical protein [Aliamphritea hakodatensis]|uniref:hypothetical protein n=1 Tax=Aliamphritea hakodatensis TaxID=2895352 RepID=UPI0022FD6200|nr:hypothetical protein [Aliamphritea hakodatensis]